MNDENARHMPGVFFSPLPLARAARRYNARMPTIQLNGETRQMPAATSVAALLEAAGYAERRVAVEINREIVPKSLHRDRLLHDGDRVEIVHALGGG